MTKPVILFDGECGLCNRMVAILLRLDRHGVFRITGGQGEVGQKLLQDRHVDSAVAFDTVAVVDGSRVLFKSDAAAFVFSQLPFPVSILGALRFVPRPVRDRAYEAVAKRRRKIANGDKACGVPPAKLRERWQQRLVTPDNVADEPQRYAFRISSQFRPLLRLLFGVKRNRAFVELDGERFVARFGHFWVETSTANLKAAQLTGPYRFWWAIGVRESATDHGLTFGSSTENGVCVCFKQNVAGLGPFRRHPALTVTVERPGELIAAINRFVDGS